MGLEGAYTAGVASKPEIMRGGIEGDGNRNAEDSPEMTQMDDCSTRSYSEHSRLVVAKRGMKCLGRDGHQWK